MKERIIRSRESGHVSVTTLILAIVITAVVVIGASFFFWKSKSAATRIPTPQQSGAVQEQPSTENSQASLKSSTPPPREVSAEDIFKLASPSVALIEVFNESGERIGTASGFVASKDGAVITNYHVIRGAYSANAHFQDGSTRSVEGVIGHDPYRDVAVVKVSDVGAKPLTLGDSEHLQVGDKVIAIGSPLALQNTVSDGLVSGIRNGIIQTSTPISPGSSGGPFFNTHGEVVGIAVATATFKGPENMNLAENVNFAVPINWAKTYLHDSTITSLADLAKQNTVVKQVLGSTISVPAHQRRVLPIVVNPHQMSNAELKGSFSSRGGVDGVIRIMVLNQNSVVYDSGRTTTGTVHLPLRAGTYQLVLDNTRSALFPRSVTSDFNLCYVK
jgi:S1-C subfamily serine protease